MNKLRILWDKHLRTEIFACASSHPRRDDIVSEDRIRISSLSRLSDSDSPPQSPTLQHAHTEASCASPPPLRILLTPSLPVGSASRKPSDDAAGGGILTLRMHNINNSDCAAAAAAVGALPSIPPPACAKHGASSGGRVWQADPCLRQHQ